MYWTLDEYLEIVVGEYRYKLVGWPRHVRFANLSDIPGGASTLSYLLSRWKSGKMRFEPLADDELHMRSAELEARLAPADECARSKRRTPRAHLGRRLRPRRGPRGNILAGPKTPVEVPDLEDDIEDADDLLPGGCAYTPASC